MTGSERQCCGERVSICSAFLGEIVWPTEGMGACGGENGQVWCRMGSNCNGGGWLL